MMNKGLNLKDTLLSEIDWNKTGGLIPVVVQDANSGQVLMLAYANKEALEKTITTGVAHFYSRSRKELWMKGQTSGNILDVLAIRLDCDSDSLLYMVSPRGPVCHTGNFSCFYKKLYNENLVGAEVLSYLFSIIAQRKKNLPEESYTASLFKKGVSKIAQKVGEEAVEVVVAMLSQTEDELKYEIADLLYMLFVAMEEKALSYLIY